MPIARELAAILRTVDQPGNFFCHGRADFPAPRIEVDGVGPVALPLLPAQARQLIKAATRAPYGRGSETVIDTTVRRTWQIDGVRVAIGGKHWPTTLAGIVARAAEGLGVTGPVTAELYKLLVYDKGSFFVGHRDTEKTPGMFATLVLALPSRATGGELVVRHKEREARLDLASDEPSEIAFAAFYADCVHEVRPVTAGCRATLVFNLVRKGRAPTTAPPEYVTETKQVATLLGTWARSTAETTAGLGATTTDAAVTGAGPQAPPTPDMPPVKLAYLLEHAYTPAELSFEGLKGADATIGRLLAGAAAKSDCDLHLALLTIWESGAAQYTGDYRHRYRRSWHAQPDEDERDDDHAFEVIEVVDGGKSISEWRRPDGGTSPLGQLPLHDDEISPPDALDDMQPDEVHFREATGNEGASFERTYARAALVIWPKSALLAVVNQGGPATTLPYLGALLDEAQAAGTKKGATFRAQAAELAGLMIAQWPDRGWYGPDRTAPSETGRMFHLLARLGEPAPVEALVGRLLSHREHLGADNAAILDALDVLPANRAAGWLKAIVETHGIHALGPSAALLAAAIGRRFAAKPGDLFPAAEALVTALPGAPGSAEEDRWDSPRRTRVESKSVVDLVAVVDRIDHRLAGRAAGHMLARPETFGLDRVVVPAAKRLLQAEGEPGPAFEALLHAAMMHLEHRVAENLEAPRNWTRANRIGCACEYCAELGRFLADPDAERWMLRAAQGTRSHVEASIRDAQADLDCETIRRGSPHSLLCIKNAASYRRRVAQRTKDLADLATLRAGTDRQRRADRS